MHELSIVYSIIEASEDLVRKHGALRVERIDLAIGDLSGIEKEALDFAWDAATRDSILDGAIRHITCIPAKARCLACGLEFSVKDFFEACPNCREYLTEIVQGKELKIQSMTLIGSKDSGC